MRGQSHTPTALYLLKRHGTHCTERWVGPRAGLEKCGKSRPPTGFDPRTIQPVASRYTDWANRTTHIIYATDTEIFNGSLKFDCLGFVTASILCSIPVLCQRMITASTTVWPTYRQSHSQNTRVLHNSDNVPLKILMYKQFYYYEQSVRMYVEMAYGISKRQGLFAASSCCELQKGSFRDTHFEKVCDSVTSIYEPTNAYIISHKTLLKYFKTLRLVSISSDHHQGALFLAKVMLQYSQFNSYLQTRCCGSITVKNYTIKYTVKTGT